MHGTVMLTCMVHSCRSCNVNIKGMILNPAMKISDTKLKNTIVFLTRYASMLRTYMYVCEHYYDPKLTPVAIVTLCPSMYVTCKSIPVGMFKIHGTCNFTTLETCS